MSETNFKQLRIAVVGGGIGGVCAALALRRAGHLGTFSLLTSKGIFIIGWAVDIFERRDFNVEVGSSLSCAANGNSHPS